MFHVATVKSVGRVSPRVLHGGCLRLEVRERKSDAATRWIPLLCGVPFVGLIEYARTMKKQAKGQQPVRHDAELQIDQISKICCCCTFVIL